MTLFRPFLIALLLLIAPPALAQSGDADWLYRGSDIARDPGWIELLDYPSAQGFAPHREAGAQWLKRCNIDVAPDQVVLSAGAQASLRVQPLSVEVTSPSQSTSITLQNNGSEVLSLQLRVFDWSQENGEDRLAPTNEVVASPPVARIAPGSSYTVRIARTSGAAAADAEESYRLWIDELPPV